MDQDHSLPNLGSFLDFGTDQAEDLPLYDPSSSSNAMGVGASSVGASGQGSAQWAQASGQGSWAQHSDPESLLKGLNDQQRAAVEHRGVPLLIMAGAGSGKTRVLTHRIAYLLATGQARAGEILAITFTNKAAAEMRERVEALVGGGAARRMWVSTFHSACVRLLRAEYRAAGLRSTFSIYDSQDSQRLIQMVLKAADVDIKRFTPKLVAARISDLKNELITWQEYRDTAPNDPISRVVASAYEEYEKRLAQSNALDFDDLISRTVRLLKDNPAIAEHYHRRFRHILVDEYQDTNYAQHAIVSQLTRENHNICVVGDDAQSIYSFRGANIDNILQFHRQYPEAITVKLEQNYRSTQNIVGAANSIIRHNKEQIEKTVYSENDPGEQILVMSAATDKEEAAKVTGTIGRLHRREEVPYDEIAILYRTNAQSRSFEDALREHNIPYRIYGGMSFYQRKEIKDIISYFRLITNLYDEEAFKRVVNYPARGIGATTLQKIFTASREHDVSLWAVAEQPGQYGVQLTKGTLSKLQSFCNLILEFRSRLFNVSAFDLAFDIINATGIRADLNKEDGPEGESKRENVEELLGAVRAFERDSQAEEESEQPITPRHVPLTEFLQQSALQTDSDEQDDGTPRVTLMTIHAAKGLEFDAVFVTGLEDNLFPGQQARLYPRELEEERRLFYVAVTRAKRFCHLTYAQSRYRYGSFEQSDESPFIREINERFVRREASNSPSPGRHIPASSRQALLDDLDGGKSRPTYGRISREEFNAQRGKSSTSTPPLTTYAERQLRRVDTLPKSAASGGGKCPLSPGQFIEHERFGRGEVLSVEGNGENSKALVDFESAGRKNLLLKFAKYEVIEP